SSSTDVNTLLNKTFSGSKNVKSGKLKLSLKLNIQGGGQVNGPVDIELGGPFESQGKGKLPQFNIDLAFRGAGQSIHAGAEHTGGVDVGKLLDDVNAARAKAGSLGLSGRANLPTKLTDAQKQKIESALKDVKVEIDTGKSD